jgi:hypothetical protein
VLNSATAAAASHRMDIASVVDVIVAELGFH